MNGYLISGATLVDGDSARPGSLRTAGERIAEELPPHLAAGDLADLAARHDCEMIDGRGLWLIPGGVDPHVHFALPAAGTVTADDFLSGSRAALAGGTTTVLDFVTPGRRESLVAAAAVRLAEASPAACDFGLHASVTAWRPETAAELATCARELGLRSVKLYLAYLETVGLADAVLEAALQAAAALDLTVLMHCEDGARIAARQRELLAAGERGPAAHPRSRPPVCEETAVVHALALAAQTECRPYLVHLSTAGAIGAVKTARARGRTVYAETCPQYLLLDESLYAGDFAAAAPYVMSPPLRSFAHRGALRAALADGVIDVVATDHCAFNLAGQKELGRDDFTRIPGGAAGVEQRLTLLYTLGVATGLLAPAAWVRLVSTRPAQIFGLYPRKGSLAAGADADLVLWDPAATWTIRARDAHGRSDHSIYEGRPVRGRPVRVWSRGETVFADGRLQAAAGRGRFLRG
jgi:dihydropyrimidinase